MKDNVLIKFNRIITCLLTLIFIVCLPVFSACGESEADLKETVLVNDDYRTMGIWGTGPMAFYNVVTDFDRPGHPMFGVVTGMKWGAFTTAGDGWLTYHVLADKNKTFDKLILDLEAHLGHKGITAYIGKDKTDLRVSVSYDNLEFTEVFSLFDTIEKIGKDEDYSRNIDLTEYAKGKSSVYVRVELHQLAFNELPVDLQDTWSSHEGKIVLQTLGVRLYGVKLTAWQ